MKFKQNFEFRAVPEKTWQDCSLTSRRDEGRRLMALEQARPEDKFEGIYKTAWANLVGKTTLKRLRGDVYFASFISDCGTVEMEFQVAVFEQGAKVLALSSTPKLDGHSPPGAFVKAFLKLIKNENNPEAPAKFEGFTVGTLLGKWAKFSMTWSEPVEEFPEEFSSNPEFFAPPN